MGDKSFKSFEEQVAILAGRGLIIDSSSVPVLMRESYYAVVNGYKKPFIDWAVTERVGDDRYRPGTTFSDIYALHQFDRNLRSLILKHVLVAETTLRSIIVYAHCAAFPAAEAYLDLGCYGQSDPVLRDSVVRRLNGARRPGRDGNHVKGFIDFYLKQHREVPLWVLAGFLSFGFLSKFYAVQTDEVQRSTVVHLDRYIQAVNPSVKQINDPAWLQRALRDLADYRNICAHGERLYCARTGGRRGVKLRKVVRDLDRLLTKEQAADMWVELSVLFGTARAQLGKDLVRHVASEAGFGPEMADL